MLYYILCMLLVPLSAQAITIEQWKMVPGSEDFHYTLIDLGPTDVPREKLSNYALPNTFAPQINDAGRITYNLMDRGYLRDPYGKISARISGMTAYSHGINNQGDLLLSYGSSSNDVRWSICSEKPLCKQYMTAMDLCELQGRNVYLRALNEDRMAVGCFKPSGMLRPLIWTKEEGLHHLGYYLGWDVVGNLWGVNSLGTVVGSMTENYPSEPFVWNKQWGMIRLQSFDWNWKVATCRPLLSPIQFQDLVVAEDDRVFGTFQAADAWNENLRGEFWWDPHTNQLRPLDLQGMRLNAINSKNTLVGSWKGKAALVDLGSTPITLEELLPEEERLWELLEASDINAQGDIVGYGLYNGELHYFLLQRKDLIKKPAILIENVADEKQVIIECDE